jgi:hypothetical protein
MSLKTFPFEVIVPNKGDGTFVATVRIALSDDRQAVDILQYIRGLQIKNDLMNNWARTNAPNYGLEVRGGPRPVFKDPADRTSPVTAYEQDFRFTRNL